MKVSNLGLKSSKIKKLDNQFPVQDILLKTGQIDQYASGIYAYGHIPILLKNKIDNIIIETLTKYNCSLINLPMLQPESIWQESGRLERYVNDDIMFRCLSDKGNFCLSPTAEEAVVKFAQTRLVSYKNLPTIYFQIGEKFRNEIRTRGYLLRGKSFEMMDAYSFGRSQEELNEDYENLKKAYIEIFKKLSLDVQPVGADSGTIGGAKSEEFMCISDIGEDSILYDDVTGKMINSELLDRSDAKGYIEETYGITDFSNLKVKKACELGHIFQLGEKYSKSMNATFIDEDGKPRFYQMGCYGIGVSRTLAMIYEHSLVKDKDNNFLSIALPVNLSPYCIYLIAKTDDEEKSNYAAKLYEVLIRSNVKVLLDDREYLSIGTKLKDSKITGIPYAAVLGKTLDEGYIIVENNKTGEKTKIGVNDFVDVLKSFEVERENGISLENLIEKKTLISMPSDEPILKNR